MGRRQNLITVTSFDESCDSTMVLRRVYNHGRKIKTEATKFESV